MTETDKKKVVAVEVEGGSTTKSCSWLVGSPIYLYFKAWPHPKFNLVTPGSPSIFAANLLVSVVPEIGK